MGLPALRPSLVAALVAFAPALAVAQSGPDQFEFNLLRDRVKAVEGELKILDNVVKGSDTLNKLQDLTREISALRGEIEQLDFRIRQIEDKQRKGFEDLEYRIIELEGGDPSLLFENNADQGLQRQGALQDGGSAPTSGGTLGRLTVDSQGAPAPAPANANASERAAFDAGVSAARAGRLDEANRLLEGVVGRYPDSGLAGEAYYWLGESRFGGGDYQGAATSFLDAATLYPTNGLAPQSLLRLGVTLSLLGQTDVACSTLREVGERYPGAGDVVNRARDEAIRVGCV